VAQHRPTGSETPPAYTSRSNRYGSELPSVEDAAGHMALRNLKNCMPEMMVISLIDTSSCSLLFVLALGSSVA